MGASTETEQKSLGIANADGFYGLDLDGDGNNFTSAAGGPFDDFYADVNANHKAAGASFINGVWQPGDSFRAAPDATYGNMLFTGQSNENASIVLGCGEYGSQERFYKCRVEDFRGDIAINDYAVVNGINLDNRTIATLSVGSRAQVNDVHAEGAHFFTVEALPGSQVVRAHCENTTIDKASRLEGSIWRNGEFVNCNLNEVKFCGAQLSEMGFVGGDLRGVDFGASSTIPGARLSHTSFVDVDITHIRADATTQFHKVLINGTEINSFGELNALQKAELIRRDIQPAMASVKPVMNAEQSMAALGAVLGTQVAQVTLSAQQSAGAGASPDASAPAVGGLGR